MFTIISFSQKLIKGGVGIRAGGLENFSKIDKRGDDYSVLESREKTIESCNRKTNESQNLKGKKNKLVTHQ